MASSRESSLPSAPRKSRRNMFKPVNSSRPAEAIQAQIRSLIASRKLKTGDRLPAERALEEQFQVSRNTIRQAIRSMADSGLLEVKKGAAGGAFISGGGAAAVRSALVDLYSLGAIQPAHLTEVRLLIGVEVVRLACQRGSDDELLALEENVQQAQAAAEANDAPGRTALNLEFYRILARMTQNPMLEIVTDAVMAITLQFVEDFMRTANVTVMPFRHALLKILRKRDADAAAELMREHLLSLQKIYLDEVAARSRQS